METEGTTAACPGCGEPLSRLVASDGVMAGCESCGAMWLDNVVCGVILAGEMSEVAKSFVRTISESARETKERGYREAAPRGQRNCPVCSSALAARVLDDPSMTIDYCLEHGAFFDRGELAALSFAAEMRVATLDANAAQASADSAYKRHEAAFAGIVTGALGMTFRR